MSLQLVFTIHAAITLAAAVVLAFAPAAIPRTVGIVLPSSAFLVSYLLAAAEFSIAVLSWGARRITDPEAIRVVLSTLTALHAASGLLEVRAFLAGGLSSAIWANVAVRFTAIAVFAYYSLAQRR
jgi:hypothetical protein